MGITVYILPFLNFSLKGTVSVFSSDLQFKKRGLPVSQRTLNLNQLNNVEDNVVLL